MSAPSKRSSRPRPTLTGWPSTGTVEEHVRAEQVRAVFGQALILQFLSVAVGALLIYALWEVTPRNQLLGWLATLTAFTTARAFVVMAFRRTNPEHDDMLRWERAFLGTLAGTTLTWGIGSLLIMPGDSVVHLALIYFFLMGVAGGAVASYAPHPTAAVLSIVVVMLPFTVVALLREELVLQIMAFGGVAYIGAAARGTRTWGRNMRRTFELSWELRTAHDLAQHQARTDALTGMNNRRAFADLATQALDQARRYDRPLSIIMFDVDEFKRINDTYGHAAGDRVLTEVGEAVRRVARAADVPVRLGGEEFALLLPETEGSDAVPLAERIRRDLAALRITHDGVEFKFTCSFGVAALGKDVEDLDDMLKRADEALYRAKRKGRNVVSRDASTLERERPKRGE